MRNTTLFCNFSRLALAAFALAVPAVSRSQSGYAITDLGAANGAYSVGSAINASGQVAGYYQQYATTIPYAVSWLGTHVISYNSFGGYWAYAYGINDSGSVTGVAFDDYNHVTYAYLGNTQTVSRLDSLGGYTSVGRAVNNSGQVAGYAATPRTNVFHAVRWTGTSAQELGALGGSNSFAYAINASGQVAGYAQLAGDLLYHAVIWNGTASTDLGTLNGANSYACGINNSGQVAGYSDTTAANVTHAVLWNGTAIIDLGTLGGAGSSASAINSHGDIVGTAQRADGSSALFLYRGGRMIDLNALLPKGSGWRVDSANSINDNGWITGQGTINGQTRAYLLKPVTATVTGSLRLEGVADLSAISPAAPLGTFHFSFRTPGSTTEIYGADAALTTPQGAMSGTFALPNVPPATYDIAIKGDKNLRLVLPNVAVSGTVSLPDVLLFAGDANNDNSVDATDFGAFVSAFNTRASVPGSGYDPTCDFNFDGAVDATDFSLFVDDYNTVGDL